MGKILYQPVCKDKNGIFYVNGATTPNEEESIRLAMKHTSFRDGEAEIIEIEKVEEEI